MLEHKIQDYPLKAPVLSYVGDDVLSEYGVMLERRLAYTGKSPSRKSDDFGWFGSLVADSMRHRDEYLLLKRTKLPEFDFQQERLGLIKRIYRKANPKATGLEVAVFAALAQALNDYCLEHGCSVDPADLIEVLDKIV